MDEKVIQIEGEDYPKHIVDAYLKSQNMSPLTEWETQIPAMVQRIIAGQLISFTHGFTYGYETASSEAPDCDECDVHGKAAERGPPESHYSQQER